MSFRFSSGTPSQELFTDIQSYNSLSDNQVLALINIVLSFLASSSAADLQDALSTFSNDHGVSRRLLRNCVRGALTVLKASARCYLTEDQLMEDFIQLGLDDKYSKIISKLYSKHRSGITAAMIGKSLCIHELVDMEWSFGVTASNNDIDVVGSTFLQLKLVLSSGVDQHREEVHMELSLPQFYKFLQDMEQAKSNMDYLIQDSV